MSYLDFKKRALMRIINSVKGFIRTVTGTNSVTLDNCVDDDSLINLKLYGRSVQQRTNLFKLPASGTQVGVTLSIDDTGAAILNGTCTESYNFTSSEITLMPGKYTFADFAEGVFPDNDYFRVQILGSGSEVLTGSINISDSDKLYTFFLSEDTRVVFRIRVNKDHTYENCKLKPMLLYGEYTADNLPEYSLKQDEPAPDNPLEIQSVGELSKNLLPDDNFQTFTSAYSTCEYEGNGVFHIYGERDNSENDSVATFNSLPYTDVNIPIELETQYTFHIMFVSGNIEGATFHPFIGLSSETSTHKNWISLRIDGSSSEDLLLNLCPVKALRAYLSGYGYCPVRNSSAYAP